MTGTIKNILTGKAFGFIIRDGQKPGDKELFFHKQDVVGSFEDLREGDSVSFEEGKTDKGPKAVNVKKN